MLSIRIAQFIASIMDKFGYVHMDRVSEIVGENAVANYKAGWDNGYNAGYVNGREMERALENLREIAAYN